MEIIEKYEPWIDYWVSEPDKGQSHTIDKGFARRTGHWATWINSNDMLQPGALQSHIEKFEYIPNVLYIGRCRIVDEKGNTVRLHEGRVESFGDLVAIPEVWRNQEKPGHIVQPEVLFPLELYKDISSLDELLDYAMDYDLWGRMLLHGASVHYTAIDIGVFRVHSSQKNI